MHNTSVSIIRAMLLALVAVAIVFLGAWLLSGRRASTPLLPKTAVPARLNSRSGGLPLLGEIQPQPPQPTLSSFDTDGDGLLDWEEALWRTDPKNSDTDGDGTPDETEVRSGRNPAKAGPHDSTEAPVSVSPLPKGVPPSAEAGVVSPAVKGVAHSDEPRVVEQPPKAAPDNNPPRQPPLLRGIKGDENPLHTFGNAVGAFIQTAAVDLQAEATFLNSAAGAKKMNPELIQGFVKLAQKYEKLASDIASVTVPEKATTAHASLSEGYRKYALSLKAMADTDLGSYLSADSLTSYSDATLALARAVVAMSDLFYAEKVGFSQTEPGHVFSFPR